MGGINLGLLKVSPTLFPGFRAPNIFAPVANNNQLNSTRGLLIQIASKCLSLSRCAVKCQNQINTQTVVPHSWLSYVKALLQAQSRSECTLYQPATSQQPTIQRRYSSACVIYTNRSIFRSRGWDWVVLYQNSVCVCVLFVCQVIFQIPLSPMPSRFNAIFRFIYLLDYSHTILCEFPCVPQRLFTFIEYSTMKIWFWMNSIINF